MKSLIAFTVGLIFSIGLIVSGMTDPNKVLSFLDFSKNWNPALIFVMVGAIFVHAFVFFFVKKMKRPLFDKTFHLPLNKVVDKKLVVGAILFGIGWGIAGICPGPGIVNLVSGEYSFFVFIASMLIGMKIFQFLQNKKMIK